MRLGLLSFLCVASWLQAAPSHTVMFGGSQDFGPDGTYRIHARFTYPQNLDSGETTFSEHEIIDWDRGVDEPWECASTLRLPGGKLTIDVTHAGKKVLTIDEELALYAHSYRHHKHQGNCLWAADFDGYRGPLSFSSTQARTRVVGTLQKRELSVVLSTLMDWQVTGRILRTAAGYEARDLTLVEPDRKRAGSFRAKDLDVNYDRTVAELFFARLIPF